MRIRALKAQRDVMRAKFTEMVREENREETTTERRAELRSLKAPLHRALAEIAAEIKARRHADVRNAEMRWRQKRAEDERSMRAIGRAR